MKWPVGRRALALLLAAAIAPVAAGCSASVAGARPAVAAHCPGVDAEAVRCRGD
jgi:hypothetical protein